jgi:hypothetical protein
MHRDYHPKTRLQETESSYKTRKTHCHSKTGLSPLQINNQTEEEQTSGACRTSWHCNECGPIFVSASRLPQSNPPKHVHQLELLVSLHAATSISHAQQLIYLSLNPQHAQQPPHSLEFPRTSTTTTSSPKAQTHIIPTKQSYESLVLSSTT